MKYIIDVPDTEGHYDSEYEMVTMRVHYGSTIVDISMDAKPYTEPNFEDIEDEVWEFARKMISTSGNEVSEMWGCITNFGEVMHNTTYQEAKAKYDAWKKEKEEIRVGDEVENASHKKGIVLNHYISPSNGLEYVRVLYMDDDGNSFVSAWEKNNVGKTGKHFDEVEEILKKMKECDSDD